MQKLIALLALLTLPFFAGGCAGLAAFPLSAASALITTPNAAALEIHNETNLRLDQANFVVVRTNVTGRSKGFALLGFISLAPAKFMTAMDRLYGSAEMEPGKPQRLADIVVEKSSTYWILFSIPQIAVRADVVEFIPTPPDESSPQPTEMVPKPVSVPERGPPKTPPVHL